MSERQKHILVWILIGLTTIPFFFLVHLPTWGVTTESLKSVALYLSATFGYIGVSLLIWELVLGTRSITGLYFQDLASKLKIHRLLGTYGMLLVFLHPLLIMYNYGETLVYTIVPNLGSQFDTGVTYGRFALMGLLLIWVTSAVARSKIAYRPWKYIHYLAYPVLLFSLLHVPGTGSSFSERGVQFFWLSFCVVIIVCTVLRLAQFFGFGKLQYSMANIEKLQENIVLVQLKPIGEFIEIRNGQYVYLQSRIFGEEHPFSVLDYNPQTGDIWVSYKVFGRFTEGLAELPIGDTLMVDGPYGVFTSEQSQNSSEPAVYIAGGIGITPFVRHALSQSGSEQYLFWGNQNQEAAVFRDTLRERMGEHFVEVYSNERVAGAGVEMGFINQALLAKYLPDPQRYQYFLCGPQGMIGAVKDALWALGVHDDQIHTEEFSF